MNILTTIVKKISTLITLQEVIKEAPDTYTFKFDVPANIQWAPGAYAHFLCSDLRNGKPMKKDLVRELSIMSHPDEKYIGITTRIRSNPSEFKQTMLSLKPGDEIRIFKLGNHINKRKMPDKPRVFISMGVGIATFRPLIIDGLKQTAPTSRVTNINIDRSGSFVYQQEVEKLPPDKVKNILVTKREDLYTSIAKCIEQQPDNIFYVVGSKALNNNISEYLVANGISKKAIVFDKH